VTVRGLCFEGGNCSVPEMPVKQPVTAQHYHPKNLKHKPHQTSKLP